MNMPTTAVRASAPAPSSNPLEMLMDPERFEHLQRVAKMFALSPLFPEGLRKGGPDVARANAVLVMNMAHRLREDPLAVAQAIYFVGGKPGWSTPYLIAKANQHGVFTGPIEFKVSGEGKTLKVVAEATLASSGTVVSEYADMAMAEAEGWTKNSKYQSIPQRMLSYRAATGLVRLYCPEVMVGVPPSHEIEDAAAAGETARDITPEPVRAANLPDDGIAATAPPAEEKKPAPKPRAKRTAAPAPVEQAEVADAEVVEEEAAPKDAEKPTPTPKVEPEPQSQRQSDPPAKQQPPLQIDMEQFGKFQAKAHSIEADLLDASDADEAWDMWASDLEEMQSHAPELYRHLASVRDAQKGVQG